MTEDVRVVTVADRDAWEAEHRRGGLPTQSWAYAHGLSASGTRPRLAVVRSGGARMLLPFYERDWGGRVDIATTLGLSGASIEPGSMAPLALWREYAAERGWVAGYVQLAPGVDVESALPGDELVESNEVMLLDLRKGSVLANASAIVRRKVRRAEALGVRLVEDRAVLGDALTKLYAPAMRRVGASAAYDLEPETLRRWTDAPHALVLGARSSTQEVDAVSLFFRSGRNAEFHLNASAPQGRVFSAWLIWQASEQLREAGVEILNLGGGQVPGDGVYRFKERFRPTALLLRAVRQTYDPIAYDELCRMAGKTAGESWFPAYRAR